MTVFQRVLFSLLASVVLFAGAAAAAYTGLFDVIEGRLYNPAISSAETSQGGGYLANGAILVFPLSIKIILLASFFLTVFLVVLFCLNIKPNPLTLVQNRLRWFRCSLPDQFYEREGGMDWKHRAIELEQRRESFHAEMKRGIRFGKGRYSEKKADALIGQVWDELLFRASGGQFGGTQPSNTLPLQKMPLVDDAGELEELESVEESGDGGNAAGGNIFENGSAEANKPAASSGAYTRRGAVPLELEPYTEKGSGLLSAAVRKRLLEHAKNVKTKSNVRIAFDRDDIPYLVESSGLEIVDDEDIDNAISAMQEDGGRFGKQRAPELTLAEAVSEIEFGGIAAAAPGEEDAGGIAAAPLEVVSPFASMFPPLEAAAPKTASAPNATQSGAIPEGAASLVENEYLAYGLPITYRPFQDTVGLEPALLESVADDEAETPGQIQPGGDVIIQQDGIHYISNSIANNYSQENLNSEFRELVDSVVTRA